MALDGDPQWAGLTVAEGVPMAADAIGLPAVAECLRLVCALAGRWHAGEDQPRAGEAGPGTGWAVGEPGRRYHRQPVGQGHGVWRPQRLRCRETGQRAQAPYSDRYRRPSAGGDRAWR